MLEKLSTRVVVVAGAASLAIFAVLAGVATDEHAPGWDSTLIGDVSRMPLADPFATLSAPLPLAVAALVVVLLLRRRLLAAALLWCATVGGTLLLDPTLKELFERPARHPDSGYTFPSGSAMLSLVVLLALLATVPAGRRWPIACLGAVFVVVQGIALVAAGWHYPSDVLAGWCAATAWAALVWLVASTRLRESALTDGSAQAGTR